jgi:DNA-binding PadR family transcriptional regulator
MFYNEKSASRGRRSGARGFHAMWGDRGGEFRGRGGFGGPRGEGRGGGRRRMFDNGELRLILLKLIADQPRHGYDLIREIESLSGGAYAPSPGVVYPTLTLLADMGLADTGLVDEDAQSGVRKLFAITDAGTTHLAEQAEAVAAAMAKLSALSARSERVDGMQVRRAMGNLREAIQIRLGRDDVSVETLHAVTALIDEAAQKIERL